MASFHNPPSKAHQFLITSVVPCAVAWCRATLLVVGLTSCTHGLVSIMQQWRNDDALAGRVEDALLQARQLNLGHIDVDVESGVVYLIGEMDSSDNKAKAQEIVAKVPGVKKVVNKLEVEP
jgi:hyperosmotically inducible protein